MPKKVKVTETTKEMDVPKGKTGWPVAVVLGVLSIFGVYSLAKYLKSKTSENASGGIQIDENARLASEIYNILRMGGATRWWEIDHYNTILGVIEVAKKIKDWKGVQQRYTDIYNENVTVLLNDVLLPADYQRFLFNLSAKGLPTNSSGTGSVKPITTIPKGTRFVFNQKANTSRINLYRNVSDYPSKPIVTLPATTKTSNALVFQSAVSFNYLGSSTKTELYQVLIPGMTTPVFVNSYFLTKIK